MELKNYDSIPGCASNNCKCGVMNKMTQKIEQDKVHQFLMALNDDIYSSIWSQCGSFATS